MINFPTKFSPVKESFGTEDGFGSNPFPPPQELLIKEIVNLIQEKKDILSKTENGKKILSLTVELDNIAKNITNKRPTLIKLIKKSLNKPWIFRAMDYPQIKNLRAEISSLEEQQRNLVRELKAVFEEYYESEAPRFVLWNTKNDIMGFIKKVLSYDKLY